MLRGDEMRRCGLCKGRIPDDAIAFQMISLIELENYEVCLQCCSRIVDVFPNKEAIKKIKEAEQ
jgi:hypothetical protein